MRSKIQQRIRVSASASDISAIENKKTKGKYKIMDNYT
jgi:hypothetical protein